MTDEELNCFTAEEINRTDCFLCRPASKLLIDSSEEYFTVAGLGPLVNGYAIVATKDHLDNIGRSSSALVRGFSDYVSSIRKALSIEFGGCLLTEHGNMPICNIDTGHSVHCFHPHVLLFPGNHHVRTEADQFFGDKQASFASLAEAFEHGAKLEQYLLVSETEDQFLVYRPQDGMPRQYARALVADSLGNPDHASWRDFPNLNESIENAKRVRQALNRNTR